MGRGRREGRPVICGCSDCQAGRFHGYSLTKSVDVAWAARDYIEAKDKGLPTDEVYAKLKEALQEAAR